MRGHWGYHPDILEGLLGQASQDTLKLLAEFVQEASQKPQKSRQIIFVFRSGHHRSVAWAWLFKGMMTTCGLAEPKMKIFPKVPEKLHGGCAACKGMAEDYMKRLEEICF